jgi:hypothetical protein
LPFKKESAGRRQDRPDVAAARKALRQALLNPRHLVFIDETSVSTTITRLYGRAPQGERLVQKVLHGNWKTLTFIAALRHNRITAPFVCEGAMNGETFKAYVEQIPRSDFEVSGATTALANDIASDGRWITRTPHSACHQPVTSYGHDTGPNPCRSIIR